MSTDVLSNNEKLQRPDRPLYFANFLEKLLTPLTSQPYTAIILDTETTTNKDTPERPLEVIELAWMPLVHELGTFERRYKPRMPPTFGAIAVHGICMTDLEGCPPSDQAPRDVPQASYWIGHNIDFDWRALGSPPEVRRICTLALSRELWPGVDSHTLTAMMYFTQGANDKTRAKVRNAHAARHDCEFVLELLQVIQAQTKCRELDDLWAMSEEARVPKKMTFGKFAGQPISAVDRGYALWYSRQADTDPYLLAAFKRQGLLR